MQRKLNNIFYGVHHLLGNYYQNTYIFEGETAFPISYLVLSNGIVSTFETYVHRVTSPDVFYFFFDNLRIIFVCQFTWTMFALYICYLLVYHQLTISSAFPLFLFDILFISCSTIFSYLSFMSLGTHYKNHFDNIIKTKPLYLLEYLLLCNYQFL